MATSSMVATATANSTLAATSNWLTDHVTPDLSQLSLNSQP